MSGLEGKRTTPASDGLGDATSKVKQNRSSAYACHQPPSPRSVLRPPRMPSCKLPTTRRGKRTLGVPTDLRRVRFTNAAYEMPPCAKNEHVEISNGRRSNNGQGVTAVKPVGRPGVCCCGTKEAPIPENLGTGAQVQANCQPESLPSRQRRSARCRERPNEDQA
jgi:hypothetical protein